MAKLFEYMFVVFWMGIIALLVPLDLLLSPILCFFGLPSITELYERL